MDDVIRKKAKRISNNGTVRTLDLFAGCGGLSLGFHLRGYDIVGAIEIDDNAAFTHATNFHKYCDPEEFSTHAQPRDITEIEPHELVQQLNLGNKVDDAIDVLIGGPPCQAFARVGRAKLREIANHPEAYLLDPRADLYVRYLHYVRELKPVAILIENVPDILNFGGHNVAEEICEVLNDLGYDCQYTLLNAVHYGVPQFRERAFLIAYSMEIDAKIRFPSPTHWIEIPKGYEGSRQVALQTIDTSRNSHYVKPPLVNPYLKPAVTAQDAMEDLPRITEHLEGRLKRGPRKFTERVPYNHNGRLSEFATLMRTWPGFEGKAYLTDHVIRYLPRDYPIFRRMRPGDQYPEAYMHAMSLLDEAIEDLKSNGVEIHDETPEYEKLKKKMVPPYDPTKFPNKWRKMEADKPARTLMAHLGKDGYSHIHYDSTQARTISVREAARLQSFPDGFELTGSMNHAFRQIGNAVPPLFAAAIAKEMMIALRGTSRGEKIGIKETHQVRPNLLRVSF